MTLPKGTVLGRDWLKIAKSRFCHKKIEFSEFGPAVLQKGSFSHVIEQNLAVRLAEADRISYNVLSSRSTLYLRLRLRLHLPHSFRVRFRTHILS